MPHTSFESLEQSRNQPSWKQTVSVVSLHLVTGEGTKDEKRQGKTRDEKRRIRKRVSVVGLTGIFLACSMWQLVVLLGAAMGGIAAALEMTGPMLILPVSLFGYWSYLIARNLTNFFFGYDSPIKKDYDSSPIQCVRKSI